MRKALLVGLATLGVMGLAGPPALASDDGPSCQKSGKGSSQCDKKGDKKGDRDRCDNSGKGNSNDKPGCRDDKGDRCDNRGKGNAKHKKGCRKDDCDKSGRKGNCKPPVDCKKTPQHKKCQPPPVDCSKHPRPQGCPEPPVDCTKYPTDPRCEQIPPGICESADLVLLSADIKILCLYLPQKGGLATTTGECPGALIATGNILNTGLGACVFLPPAGNGPTGTTTSPLGSAGGLTSTLGGGGSVPGLGSLSAITGLLGG